MTHTLKDVLPHTARLLDGGHLEIGGLDVTKMADEYGTPLFVFCEQTLRDRCRAYRAALPEAAIYYASKAFICKEVARIVSSEGVGLDVASAGELHTVLGAGVDPSKLIMHGNNKSDAE